MPEGVEVRIITLGLRKHFQNSTVNDIIIHGGRYKKHNNLVGLDSFKNNLPLRLSNIECKGKFIYFTFSNGMYLFNTLGMSGHWTLNNQKKHNNVEFKLFHNKKEISLFFNDMRNFGTLKFINSKKDLEKKLNELGPDMFEKETTFDVFKKAVKAKGKWNITKVLMDQKIISGVGNYIKSESLYRSAISPHRTIDNLSEEELKKLFNEIKYVIDQSYFHQGASVRDYSDVEDKKGDYHEHFVVYGKSEDDYGNLVKRFTSEDKRTTHWVPEIQK